jgi:hypothetical protein
MGSRLVTNNATDIIRMDVTNKPIFENDKCMDRHWRLSNNVIRIQPTTKRQGASLTNMDIRPNYNIAKVESNVTNDLSVIQYKKSLKIFCQNIRGLRNKYNELFCH